MTGMAATGDVAARSGRVSLSLGPYRAEIGTCDSLLSRALELRRQAFAQHGASDADVFDPVALHGIVTDTASGRPCVGFRVRVFPTTTDLNHCYTGQFYDLSPLSRQPGSCLELGRLCQDRMRADPVALRVAWAALTRLADAQDVALLIGCSSFAGADTDRHAPALAALKARHLGPPALRPRRKSPLAFDLPGADVCPGPLPPLLRSYLGLGGWVSDHAVCDPVLDTVHVFTGLCVADIPNRRKQRLRAMANSHASLQPLDVLPAAP
jgi:L-ornithine Nalpha-acyltransferase